MEPAKDMTGAQPRPIATSSKHKSSVKKTVKKLTKKDSKKATMEGKPKYVSKKPDPYLAQNMKPPEIKPPRAKGEQRLYAGQSDPWYKAFDKALRNVGGNFPYGPSFPVVAGLLASDLACPTHSFNDLPPLTRQRWIMWCQNEPVLAGNIEQGLLDCRHISGDFALDPASNNGHLKHGNKLRMEFRPLGVRDKHPADKWRVKRPRTSKLEWPSEVRRDGKKRSLDKERPSEVRRRGKKRSSDNKDGKSNGVRLIFRTDLTN